MQAVWPDTVAQETRERLLRALAIERETPELRRCFLKLDDEFQPLRAGDDVRELPLEVRDPLQARIGRRRFGAAPPSVHTMCSSISTLAAFWGNWEGMLRVGMLGALAGLLGGVSYWRLIRKPLTWK